MDPGEKTEQDISGRASFFEKTDGAGMLDNRRELEEELMESPLLRRTIQVRSTNYVFPFCHKHWSFKLHVERGINSHVGSTLL
jgi:hypothetical protein